ncbi:hypothetical protein Dsin_004036 [Dipteronia sinensis]|uniref:Protein kinase domain-containing protein n=1 Tax=Dipteronia sinensis TaxID=43782 RepID=A0AAE0BA21_9ROSI|nr:hypothetical protein Dsin_004036 [Dipteronia sinensis]
MGSCFSVRIKAESPLHNGVNSSSRISSVPSRTEGEILQSSNLKSFSFNELKAATRNFRPDSVLGEGGFGCVFKGWIDENTFAATRPGTGLVIAVKRLNQDGFQGHQEWLPIELSHQSPNVVPWYTPYSKRSTEILFLEKWGHLTTKSDVYSFGVVLLELLSGRRAIDKNRPSGEQNLVEWAKPYLQSKRKIFQVMDARIEGQYSLSSVLKAATLAIKCLSTEPKSRPNIDEVVNALEQLQESNDVEPSRNEPRRNFDSTSSNSPRRRRASVNENRDRRAATHPTPSASPLRT